MAGRCSHTFKPSTLSWVLWTLALACQGTEAWQTCTAREACRVVEYRPVIQEESSGLEGLEWEGSGTNAVIGELDYGGGLANDPPTVSPYEQASYILQSHQLCQCPGGLECPDENSTDSERSLRLDTFTELKLCTPKLRYPICRDFRRPIIRVFKEMREPSDQDMRFAKATVWCNCESGRFGKVRTVEVWMNGRQHAAPYSCSRNRDGTYSPLTAP